jgi:tetratricopeptide (TPR) repeat protein
MGVGTMKITKSGCLVALVLAVLAAPVLAGDLIQFKTGKWFPTPPAAGAKEEPSVEDLANSTITVLDEDYDVTTYKYADVPNKQKWDTAKIKRVVYGEKPSRFLEAGAAMGSGDYANALALYDELAGNRRNKDWVRMYSLYNIGLIYQEGTGDWAKAIDAWDRLQKAFPKSRFLPKALVSKGLAQLNLGQEAKARQAFGQLQRLRGLPEGEKKTADYWLIKITQLKGEKNRNTALINEALEAYKRLLSEVEGDSELQNVAILARLGIGDCLLALEKYGEALAFFQKIADSSDDSSVLAGAFNGLGRCHFAKEEWDKALMSFLRTVILYDTNPETTAMALYWAAKSYTMRQGDEWKTRARSLFRECMGRFPTSSWARKSKEDLPTVR